MDNLIRIIRQKAGMNQEEFAHALNTTVLSINRWENDKTLPNPMAQSMLFQFCQEKHIDVVKQLIQNICQNSNDFLFHGSRKGIESEIKPCSSSFCDFGSGFYMGDNPLQPLTLVSDNVHPVFYILSLDKAGLKSIDIRPDINWALLIAYHRGYMEEYQSSSIYDKYSHYLDGYDIVTGGIADDRMFRVMTRFFQKEITDVALIHCLKTLDLGNQVVAKTGKACSQIHIVSEHRLSQLEWNLIEAKGTQRRGKAISLTEEICVKYRREGKYFDEIMEEGI